MRVKEKMTSLYSKLVHSMNLLLTLLSSPSFPLCPKRTLNDSVLDWELGALSCIVWAYAVALELI